MNISGSEDDLVATISAFFPQEHFSVRYTQGNSLIVQRREAFSESRKLLITTSVDTVGFLALFCDSAKAYLSLTANEELGEIKGETLLSSKGKEYVLCCEKNDTDSFFVKGKNIPLGEAFRFQPEFSTEKDLIAGRFVSCYALISVLMNLKALVSEYNVALSFCTFGNAGSFQEAIVSKLVKPDFVICLGTMQSEEKSVILLKKDGKQFSDRLFSSLVQTIAKKSQILLSEQISEQKISPIDSVCGAHSAKVLSLALPCRNKNLKNESVFQKSLQDLTDLLRAVSTEIFTE